MISWDLIRSIWFARDCPVCNGQLVQRVGKHGYFIGCSRYPNCTWSCNDLTEDNVARGIRLVKDPGHVAQYFPAILVRDRGTGSTRCLVPGGWLEDDADADFIGLETFTPGCSLSVRQRDALYALLPTYGAHGARLIDGHAEEITFLEGLRALVSQPVTQKVDQVMALLSSTRGNTSDNPATPAPHAVSTPDAPPVPPGKRRQKKTVREQAKRVGRAIASGVELGVIDQTTAVMLDAAKAVLPAHPLVDVILATEDGRNGVAFLMSFLLITGAENFPGAIPGANGAELVASVAERSLELHSYKLFNERLKAIRPQIAKLVELGLELRRAQGTAGQLGEGSGEELDLEADDVRDTAEVSR